MRAITLRVITSDFDEEGNRIYQRLDTSNFVTPGKNFDFLQAPPIFLRNNRREDLTAIVQLQWSEENKDADALCVGDEIITREYTYYAGSFCKLR